jgi:ABC-2 type transport system permease protein
MRFGMLWALFIASGKMFVRNRAAVFFSIFLPLVIMLIFGVLNFEAATEIEMGIVDEANNEASAGLVEDLDAYDYLVLTQGNRDDELAALADGDRDFVLVIPPDWAIPAPGGVTGLVAYAGNADPAQAQVAQGLLQQAVGQALFAAPGGGGAPAGVAPPVAFESVESRDLGYIDFLVPGIVGFVQLKRTGALRRLFATPTSPSYFLSAQVLSRLIIGLVQVAILFAVGIWFGLQMFGSYMTLFIVVIIGSAIFLAIGFAIAGWAKNEDQAAPVANLISLPMMFLSGVFFPREAMPDFLAGVTALLPLTYVIEALRAIVNRGADLLSLGPELLGMAVWVVISFVVAVRLFRWE